jgi:hypothetical protein
MTNHPNRSTKMHHFGVVANARTGYWDFSTAEYLGLVDRREFLARTDTADVHYDQHDGEVLEPIFWDRAVGVTPTKSNVAMTIKWAR